MELSPVPVPVTVPDRSAPSRRRPAGHPAYQWRSIAPEDKKDGGEPGQYPPGPLPAGPQTEHGCVAVHAVPLGHAAAPISGC